jgi:hypothetical protein
MSKLSEQEQEQERRAELDAKLYDLRSATLRIAEQAVLSFRERSVRCDACYLETQDPELSRFAYVETYDAPLFAPSKSKSKLLLCRSCYDKHVSVNP